MGSAARARAVDINRVTHIVVLGASGSGKTWFVNHLRQCVCTTSLAAGADTNDGYCIPVVVKAHRSVAQPAVIHQHMNEWQGGERGFVQSRQLSATTA